MHTMTIKNAAFPCPRVDAHLDRNTRFRDG